MNVHSPDSWAVRSATAVDRAPNSFRSLNQASELPTTSSPAPRVTGLSRSLYSYSGLLPHIIPQWRKDRDAKQAAQEFYEPGPKAEQLLATWPRELADFARQRWHSIAGRITYNQPKPSSYQRANYDLWDLEAALAAVPFDIGTDDAALCEVATRAARISEQRGMGAAVQLLEKYGIDIPHGRHITGDGLYRRLCGSQFWRSRLRATFGQTIENALRSRGLVRKGRAPYASDWAVRRRHSQKTKQRDMLKIAKAISEDGQELSLVDIADRSISNPVIRRVELMIRMKGFGQIAEDLGHRGRFYTLTAPSCFHAQLASGGENPRFNRSTVRDAQAWMQKMWARVRTKLKRLKITWYGMRVVEPHHDGTPHWHLLVLAPKEQMKTIHRVLRHHWLSEFGDEPGATIVRIKVKPILRRTRSDGTVRTFADSVAGYLAKYIAKNIDGHGVGEDFETGTDADDACVRVDAWASTHRIRQFQQFGGPPVTLWREARRLREPVAAIEIETARRCADSDDWCGFIQAVGGIAANYKTAITTWKEEANTPNRYGEPRAPIVIGLKSAFNRIKTRLTRWIIDFSGSVSGFSTYLGPVSITVRNLMETHP